MINWEQVKQLEEDIGAEDFGEVVTMFIDEVDEAVDALRDNPSMGAADLAAAMHFLKGSSANLGFVDFASLCEEGEKKGKSGETDTVNLSAVCTTYDASKTLFLAEVSNHTSFIPN